MSVFLAAVVLGVLFVATFYFGFVTGTHCPRDRIQLLRLKAAVRALGDIDRPGFARGEWDEKWAAVMALVEEPEEPPVR